MYIKVKVTAGSRKEIVEKISSDHYDISVREPAERNLANGKVRELMALEFLVPIQKVRIVSGHHHPSKILSISVEK